MQTDSKMQLPAGLDRHRETSAGNVCFQEEVCQIPVDIFSATPRESKWGQESTNTATCFSMISGVVLRRSKSRRSDTSGRNCLRSYVDRKESGLITQYFSHLHDLPV